MEPTKIPVSCLTIPLGMCAEFRKGQKLGNLFSRETAISISSHMTGCKGEGVLIAVQVSEEIVLECCSVSMPSDVSSQTVITSSNLADASLLKSFNTNTSPHAAINSCRNDSNSKSRHSLSSSSNSRHSYSQRHHPYSSSINSWPSWKHVPCPVFASDNNHQLSTSTNLERVLFPLK